MTEGFLDGDYQDIPARGLTEATCRKFGYRVGRNKAGQSVQIADYRDADGALVAQKVRDRSKDFVMLGAGAKAPLFGQHLWSSSGRRIVVTEGEIDAMSVAQVFGLSWAAVSVPNGAGGAKKALQRALEYFNGYDTVVLSFDMDDEGRKAAAECAPLFRPGQCAIAELPLKDANAMLLAGKTKELTSAIWNARTWRPGGIVSGADTWERVQAEHETGLPYPWEGLTKKTSGQRLGTLVMWTSGTGMGKSSAVAQVVYDLAFPSDPKQEPLTVGYVALEEDVGRAAQRFLSHRLNKLVHMPENGVSEVALRKAFDDTLATNRVMFYDHFGSADSDDLISKLRYLAKGCGCRVLVLDSISTLVSGMDLSGDERRTLDRTMTLLRMLVAETGVLMHVISHLKRPGDEKGHEEGARVTLAQLRGSGAIAQLSDMVIGLERNLQAQAEDERVMTLRVLKNRTTGETGPCGLLAYNRISGKLVEVTEGGSPFSDETGQNVNPGEQDF